MATDDKKDELEGTEQPFVSHLIELRDRLIRASIAVGVCFGVLMVWPGSAHLYDLLAAPLVEHLPKGGMLIATSVISPFLVPLKITLMAAFLLALPVVLYQVWAFVAPGLYTHEKKLVLPLVISSSLLFFLGIAFCYFFVFGKVFTFIQNFAPRRSSARRSRCRSSSSCWRASGWSRSSSCARFAATSSCSRSSSRRC